MVFGQGEANRQMEHSGGQKNKEAENRGALQISMKMTSSSVNYAETIKYLHGIK